MADQIIELVHPGLQVLFKQWQTDQLSAFALADWLEENGHNDEANAVRNAAENVPQYAALLDQLESIDLPSVRLTYNDRNRDPVNYRLLARRCRAVFKKFGLTLLKVKLGKPSRMGRVSIYPPPQISVKISPRFSLKSDRAYSLLTGLLEAAFPSMDMDDWSIA